VAVEYKKEAMMNNGCERVCELKVLHGNVAWCD